MVYYSNVQGIWNDSCTTASITETGVYPIWVANSCTTSSVTTNGVWTTWATTSNSSGNDYYVAPHLSAEELARRKVEQEKFDRKAKQDAVKNRIKKTRAKRRGLNLLRMILTADEFNQWMLFRSVRFRGSLGGYYEVGGGPHGRLVYRLNENGTPKERICYQPSSDFIIEDQVCALILDIKCDESRVISKGNPSTFFSLHEGNRVALRRSFKDVGKKATVAA